ncbi:MAG: hypothetical protein H6924_02415 [Alphaproteobacteria bacterium]|nr:hypothetical protein [Alphaproteobacteria bacterium]
MKTFALFSSLAVLAAFAAPASAITPVHRQLYNVDAARVCTSVAAQGGDLADGLRHCNTALSDPNMTQRAALLVNRGIIQGRMDNRAAALNDYNAALAIDPRMGDAYVNRAALYVAEKNHAAARADIAQALQLGAHNLHVAYYARAVMEDEAHNYPAAYQDYKKALELKPDYAPAARELSRFKVVDRTASASTGRPTNLVN